MTAPPRPDDGPERLLQHADALRRLARRLVHDDADADDLVQETWTAVLEKPRTHEPASGWKRWLFGVARNLARERRRSAGRRTHREQVAARPEGSAAGVEIVEQLETFRMLADELSHLDEPYRSTLYRRFFEGHSHARIAQDDGIAEASVRSRQSRGLDLLRERLDRRQPGGRGSWTILLERISGRRREPPIRPAYFVLSGAALLVVATVVVVTSMLSDRGEERGDAARKVALAPGDDRTDRTATRTNDDLTEDSAGSARVSLAPATADQPATLRLVDLRTGEPLAGFQLRIGVTGGATGGGTGRDTQTYADGRVDLPVKSGTFDLALTLVDDPRLDTLRREHAGGRKFAWTIPPVRFQPGSEACTLQVAVGPRFAIRFEHAPQVPLEELHAELQASDTGSMRATSRAPLREPLEPGRPVWVRFLDEATYLGGAPPYRLRIADDAGLLCGEAEVGTLVGAPREPITIALAPRGSVRIDVSDASGMPVRARLTLLREGHVIARAASDAGPVVFRWLVAGVHEIRIESAGQEPMSVTLLVEPGATKEQRVVLRSLPSAGRVTGSSRQLDRAVRFVLENDLTRDRCETEGHLEGDRTTFAFEDVPEGSWTLHAHAAGVWRWKPAELKVTPPAIGLVLEPADISASDVRAIKFRAFDAKTGDRVDHFQVDLQCGAPGGERATRITGFGNLVFESVPLDAHLDWVLSAEGYRPARGGRDALQRKGEQDLVRVELVRGWERALSVRDARTRAPLAGAHVVVDGEPAGTTDDHGTLVLVRPSAPRRIAVALDGWQFAGGSIDADGTWTSETPSTLAAFLTRER